MKFSASNSSSDELNSSRLQNLHWCTCHHCTVMPTFVECKCCEEFPELLKDKLNNACITDHKDFDVLCLHKSVFTKQCVFSNSCYIYTWFLLGGVF